MFNYSFSRLNKITIFISFVPPDIKLHIINFLPFDQVCLKLVYGVYFRLSKNTPRFLEVYFEFLKSCLRVIIEFNK